MLNKQQTLKTCLQENQFISPAYQSYGGLSGYHDYGILGIKLKNKFLQEWRSFFLENNDIFEVENNIITPYNVLDASGHVERFTDFVVYDDNNICYRADHLAKKFFKEHKMNTLAEQVDSWNQSTLELHINKYKMLDNKESIVVTKKNLMFEVPSVNTDNNNKLDFLRPELAQGIFVNFKEYQQFLQKDINFGIAQIGNSYRKEISPQQFTRMRCFSQAEIEYFCDPINKTHHNFDNYKNTIIPILTVDMQLKNINEPLLTTVNDAVQKKLINHELIAYFLAKIYLFAMKIGLKQDKIRFRQHMNNEMAHYAIQCWDLETLVNNDWLECIGCADRGSYDLECHSKRSNVNHIARRKLTIPITTEKLVAKIDKKILGQQHKSNSGEILKYFDTITHSELEKINTNKLLVLNINNKNTEIDTTEFLSITEQSLTQTHEEYYPHVIEPSFGIDRLIYSILEQNFWARDNDIQRIVLSLPYILSPYDVSIQTLSKKPELVTLANKIYVDLCDKKLKCHLDNSSTNIGKRYARIDEIGIKYVITIDFESLVDNRITIRERDTMIQIRVDILEIYKTLKQLNK